jgi:NAD(P)-dependent dehydrogenase (short-subunit alcohol dehydrogenase family)
MTITLITGANKGLGFETARQLIQTGHTVYLGARDPERGHTAAAQLGARWIELDVTSDASVDAAAQRLEAEEGRIDVLINNAAIAGGFVRPREVTGDELQTVLDTNVIGVVRVTHRLLPLLERSSDPVIVNVSSSLGSIALGNDPAAFEHAFNGVAYTTSKAALNMLTIQYAKAYPKFRINTVNPGYTATDLNGNRGTQSVEEGAEIIVRMASIGSDGPTATFQDANGALPW